MKTNRLWITGLAAFLMATFFVGCKDENVGIDGVCPLVLTTSPVNLATGVPLDQVISVTFNEPMNPATITPAAFSLTGPAGSSSGREAVSGSTQDVIAGSLTYSAANNTMSFVPTLKLKSNTTYIGKVTAGVKDMMGNALQVDYIWTFSTGATVLPSVISTDPANVATGVVTNKTVTATFNAPMDPLSITTTTYTLKQGTTSIAGAVSYLGSTASFKPTVALTANTVYTATITTGAKNTAGIALPSDYVWTFTTGVITAPTVTSTDPLNLATGVALNKVVSAVFSEAMNATTISTTTFTLFNGATAIAGTVNYSGTTATFTPTVNLTSGVTYTATVTTGAKNSGGTALASAYVWSFTTGVVLAPTVTLTDPLNLATGVPLNKVISAVFSTAMDPTTITTSTFTVANGATPVTGTVTYTGTTATFTPTGNLLSGSTYTATVTTGAKNLAGTPLATNFVWNFNTSAPLGPLAVDLKSVARFGIIAGVGVSNNAGFSEIHNLDVGISPGVRSSVTGFPPAVIVNGALYASDDLIPVGTAAMLIQAKQDLTDAYLFAEGATTPAPATVSGDLGGTTLAPGIYKSTSTLLIQSGDLTLDAQGDVNAVWIFQIASGFTTVGGAGGNVILIGGAQAKNIFWQTGSSSTIGDFTSFKGNVLALTSITMNTAAKAEGRMLARNGSVVMT